MNTLTLFVSLPWPAFLLVALLVHRASVERALRHWADANDYEIVRHRAPRSFEKVPFRPSFGWKFFRVLVRDREGKRREGWLRGNARQVVVAWDSGKVEQFDRHDRPARTRPVARADLWDRDLDG